MKPYPRQPCAFWPHLLQAHLFSPLLFLVPLLLSLTIQRQRARQSQAWPSHRLLKAEKRISLVPGAGCGEAAWFLWQSLGAVLTGLGESRGGTPEPAGGPR